MKRAIKILIKAEKDVDKLCTVEHFIGALFYEKIRFDHSHNDIGT